MTAPVSGDQLSPLHTSKAQSWLTCLALSLAVPALYLSIQKLLAVFVPATLHGSTIQRYCIGITALTSAEWIVVLVLLALLHSRGETLRDLDTWHWGTWLAWVIALGIALLSVANGLRILPRLGIPRSAIFQPTLFHIYAALLIGITAGFCEEVIFRGFMMTEFARMGYGKLVQVVVPGFFFGLAHLAFLKHGVGVAVGVMVPTAIMGMIWGTAYLAGRRSLLPCMVAHFLNDSTALPWILFFMVSHKIQ